MKFKEISLKGKYIIDAKIELLTGLHVGTAGNSLDIGGVDNPVIKDAMGKPYIPGSSLKGKLRSLMEFYNNKLVPNQVVYTVEPKNDDKENKERAKSGIRMHLCNDENCEVCNLFGRNHGNHKVIINNNGDTDDLNLEDVIQPTRLIVRDASLDESSITKEMQDNMDFDYTEVKFENNLDRITSAANPRQTERVPAGAKFNCSFVINVYNDDNDTYLKEFLTALKLLEDDYLGGQGSRGYGQVKFKDIVIRFRDDNYYKQGQEDKKMYEYKELSEVKF
ncbi:type III-A CRISPR-associated RAMP protein Csm3 [Caloramator sp. E03]|uniref:type III-A CRISPR-associated RAMP protein Csm3 n=1 Tax=Caloramator sp. E03 TaxID=2576307 RepID=UPI0011104750|nr:type III-A CRISPR-associated RAMP protein Csm3 [Caloramator sp. E03]QCX34076.1 type III-A CRISPR-associated RAMP protein Csm3 [Caloramator sp. E03]